MGPVSTYRVAVNVTLIVAEKLVERARDVARQQGKSLDAVVREFLERFSGEVPSSRVADGLMDLMRKHPGASGGRGWGRADGYAGRMPR